MFFSIIERMCVSMNVFVGMFFSIIERRCVSMNVPKSKQTYPWITPEIKKTNGYKESETDTTLKQ